MTLLDLVSKGLRALGGAEGRAGRAQGAFFFCQAGGATRLCPRAPRQTPAPSAPRGPSARAADMKQARATGSAGREGVRGEGVAGEGVRVRPRM
jgi:hypothetical protein